MFKFQLFVFLFLANLMAMFDGKFSLFDYVSCLAATLCFVAALKEWRNVHK